MITPDLHRFALVIINSSGGKDSICAIDAMVEMAKDQNYPMSQLVISHQDLGEVEWKGTRELVEAQAKFYGLHLEFSARDESLLDYVERRGKWPSSKQRFCTSEFKRSPGAKVVTRLSKGLGECEILHVFGFRAEESPARSKREVMALNKRLTTKKRKVWDFLPIHTWSTARVWRTIREKGIPSHQAYEMGMPRLSCVFCIFAPFDALVTAGKENPELLDKYVAMEEKIGHSFRQNLQIGEVKKAIQEGYEPATLASWNM